MKLTEEFHIVFIDKKLSNWHWQFLVLLASVYLVVYLAHSALPGNNFQYPLGWWGWIDQGLYIKAAKAAASLNFDSANYFYPPLYPLLGALFVKTTPMHPFALIDLTCFIIFAHYFVKYAQSQVGWALAVVIFLFSFLGTQELVLVWVEPWTSSPVAAAFAYLLFWVDKINKENKQPSARRVSALSACGGLVAATRPLDAIVLIPLFGFLLWHILRIDHAASHGTARRNLFALVVPGMMGIGFFVIFNLLVHGSAGGIYFSAGVTANGFHLSDLIEKAVSLAMDPGPLYNVPHQALFAKLKWLALLVPAAIFGLLAGPASIKLWITLVVMQIVLYFPYSDLLPNGLWRYHNIHYFKWLMPFAALVIYIWMRALFLNSIPRKSRAIAIGSLVIGFLLLCIRVELLEMPSQGEQIRNQLVRSGEALHIEAAHMVSIDKINLGTLHGSFDEVYFGKGASVRVDGVELHRVRDYRFLPSEEGVSLLFIRPVNSKIIEIESGDMTFERQSPSVRIYQYGYSIGWPAWVIPAGVDHFSDTAARLGGGYNATLSEGIDFTRRGYPFFIKDVAGMSGYEEWGRWSDTGADGRVVFTFKTPLPKNFRVELIANALGPNIGASVRVKAGSCEREFVVKTGERNKTYSLDCSDVTDTRTLEIIVPHPVRPKDIIPNSKDSRLVGLAFISLRIMERNADHMAR